MKEIYLQIRDILKAEVANLRWIDLDTDQMGAATRPAIALPAALINIDINNCKSLADKVQLCNASITVSLIFDNPGPTSSVTPANVVNLSLKPYDIISDVQAVLQGFETELLEPLSRIRQGKVKNRHGLFQYEIQYRTIFED